MHVDRSPYIRRSKCIQLIISVLLKDSTIHCLYLLEATIGATDNIVRCSYKIALQVAKLGRPYTEGEFVKDCLLLTAEQLCTERADDFWAISLFGATIARRIQEMAMDVMDQLCDVGKNFICFSLALGEAMDVTSTSHVAIFIREVNVNLIITLYFFIL